MSFEAPAPPDADDIARAIVSACALCGADAREWPRFWPPSARPHLVALAGLRRVFPAVETRRLAALLGLPPTLNWADWLRDVDFGAAQSVAQAVRRGRSG